MTEPDYKNLLLSLCATLTQVDHMGAAWPQIEYVLRMCGINPAGAGGKQDIEKALASLGIKTLNGTTLTSGYPNYY